MMREQIEKEKMQYYEDYGFAEDKTIVNLTEIRKKIKSDQALLPAYQKLQ